MSAKDKFYSTVTASHGVDYIGTSQPTGAITATANASTINNRYTGKLFIRMSQADLDKLQKGQALEITNLGTYNGLTRVLAKSNSSVAATLGAIVDVAFNAGEADGTGNWSATGGRGAWDGFMPVGADLGASDITTLDFHFPERQSGVENTVVYKQDQIYSFPGVIKNIKLGGTGTLALIRARTTRPR